MENSKAAPSVTNFSDSLLVAGAARTGGAAAAGRPGLGAGGGGHLKALLGVTGAHQLFHPGLAAVRALHFRVAPEDQLLEILVTGVAMKLKNRHLLSPLQKIWKKGQGV
jgi:hypothetical protein